MMPGDICFSREHGNGSSTDWLLNGNRPGRGPHHPRRTTARVLALDEQWAQAEDHRDEAALKRILDEGFIQTETGEDSKTVDKATYIRQVMSGSASMFQTLTHHAASTAIRP